MSTLPRIDESPASSYAVPVAKSGRFSMGVDGLRVEGKPSFEEWERFGRELAMAYRSCRFNLGDWLLEGEARYGEMYAQALNELHWSLSTLQKAACVARAFPIRRRRWQISTTFYEAVASIKDEQVQEELLDRVVNENWTREQVRAAAQSYKHPERATKAALDITTPPAALTHDPVFDDSTANHNGSTHSTTANVDPGAYEVPRGASLADAADELARERAHAPLLQFPKVRLVVDAEDLMYEPATLREALVSGPVTLKMNGRPFAVVLPFTEYERIRDALDMAKANGFAGTVVPAYNTVDVR